MSASILKMQGGLVTSAHFKCCAAAMPNLNDHIKHNIILKPSHGNTVLHGMGQGGQNLTLSVPWSSASRTFVSDSRPFWCCPHPQES